MSVLVTPIGGLGNQLFVYATGKALSRRLKLSLVVDKSHYRSSSSRAFELESFDSDFEEIPSGDRLRFHISKFFVASIWRLRRISNRIFAGQGLRVEESFLFNRRSLRLGRTVALYGYFQSWRYFSDIADELRGEIRRIQKPSDFYTRLSEEIGACNPSVAVHVRRGDYVPNKYMGLITERYYQRALELLESLVGDLSVYIFSDNIETLQGESFLAKWGKRLTYVHSPSDSRPIESLNLIANCDHVIMANSSFSWWGAWLGERKGRYVVYPRPWLAGALVDDRDLALPGWICLGDK